MTQSQIVQVVLVLLTAWCVSSTSIVPEIGSKNDSKPVIINGLYEQIDKDIVSGWWEKSVQLMRRHLNQTTEAYKQLDNITERADFPLVAAQNGYVELIKVMLNNGLPINRKYGMLKYTMLHKAAYFGQYKLVKFLIQQGAKVDLKTWYGYTELHYAANNGYVNVVQLLVESGANINAYGPVQDTPLHYAARNGQKSVVQYLVNKGCDTTITNGYNKIPADVAKTPEIRAIIEGKREEVK